LVNVVAVRFDEIEGTVLLEVACWGGRSINWIYNDYYNRDSFGIWTRRGWYGFEKTIKRSK